MSLSILSSSVDENALISLGGRSLINQMVSLRSISLPVHWVGSFMIHILPTLVQSVANSLFSAKTHLLVSELRREDFPALVYQTIPTVGSHFLILDSLWSLRIFSYSLSFCSILRILSLKCLFMISVLVSHCHLEARDQLDPPDHPDPPHCLLSSIPIP